MDKIHQSTICSESSDISLSESRKIDEKPFLQDRTNDHGTDDKLETESESQTELCGGFCQECDWVNLDNFDSVNEKLKELEPILYDSFRVQSHCCKKLLKKKEMLLILVLELQEIRRRISFDRMMMDVVKEEKTRLRREYKHLKNQEMKEKEHNLEKYDCNLFKEYQALKSVSAAEDFLGTIIQKKKTLENLEVLIQHKISTFKRDEVKNLKRKKGAKLRCKKSKSRSPSKSTANQRNTEPNSLALSAENITFNNAVGQQNRFSDTEERLERLRNRMRDVFAQHAIEMDLEPFLETHL